MAKVVSQEAKPFRPRKEIYIGVATLVITVAICFAAVYYQDDLMNIANIAGYSLLGVFIISFVAGSIFSFIPIPVPYWLFVFTLSSVLAPQWGLLAPVWVGMTSAFATSLGHLPTFMIGYGGGKTYEGVAKLIGERIGTNKGGKRLSLYNRCMDWARRHGSWTSFAMSAVFNPLHLPMTIAIGTLRYHPLKFFAFSFLGNSVKGLFLAFCGYFGLGFVLRLFGVNMVSAGYGGLDVYSGYWACQSGLRFAPILARLGTVFGGL
jgi:membrane protein DedA with SNARE-associated domain